MWNALHKVMTARIVVMKYESQAHLNKVGQNYTDAVCGRINNLCTNVRFLAEAFTYASEVCFPPSLHTQNRQPFLCFLDRRLTRMYKNWWVLLTAKVPIAQVK